MPVGKFPAIASRVPLRRRHAAEHRVARVRHQRYDARCWSRRRSAGCCSTPRSRTTSRSSTESMRKRDITEVVGELVVSYDKAVVADSLDLLKALGFEWSTRAGLTISIADVTTPPQKAGLLEKFEGEAAKVENQFERGIITDDERRQQEIEIWTDATNQVTRAMQDMLAQSPFNPIDMMVGSGARGNVMQVRQIAGMRGLVANPRGEIIPRPIKSNFREGLSVLEYFISTHGARKGLADTALRTADSGYLTRRLVDVAQELDHPRGGLRDRPWHLGRGCRARARGVASARDQPARPFAGRGRHARRRHRRSPQHRGRRRRDASARRRPRLRPAARAHRAHVRDGVGRVRALLRAHARDRQARRPRRGDRHRRRAVDRRARHAVDDADVPHRRCRR